MRRRPSSDSSTPQDCETRSTNCGASCATQAETGCRLGPSDRLYFDGRFRRRLTDEVLVSSKRSATVEPGRDTAGAAPDTHAQVGPAIETLDDERNGTAAEPHIEAVGGVNLMRRVLRAPLAAHAAVLVLLLLVLVPFVGSTSQFS